MREKSHSNLQIPLILLATVNLVMIGSLLWPWQEAVFVPGSENPAFDLTVILPIYMGFIWWLAHKRGENFKLALAEGVYFGPLSGVLLVAHIVLLAQGGDGRLEWLGDCLWAGAGLLWTIAGARGARAAEHGGMGLFAGMWSGLLGCLIASTFALACMLPGVPNIGSGDAAKQTDAASNSDSAAPSVLQSMLPVEQLLLVGVNGAAVLGLVSGVIAARKQD